MSVEERLRVPIGTAPGWSTAPGSHRVLVVVHTVTALTRLLDILPLFESDPRIQVVFTRARTSNFREGVTQFLNDIGAIIAPWEQAMEEEFDLAITASYGDDLHHIKAPLVAFSHGAGYNKIMKPETGNRKPETGDETSSPEAVFGLAAPTLFQEGELVPEILVLSHTEQLDRLLAACPEAVDSALVAGDPTHDRILAGLPWRERYRDHLETGNRKLILVSSTWGPTSLLGAWPRFLDRLLAELPVDEYRVALALHPNVWHGHGTWQVRAWLAEAERAGLRVLPPRQGWQAALVAADHVIGDHGSVTFYGAAQGTHTMLATFPHHEMAGGSPIAGFGRAATRLRTDRPLLPQILNDAADHTPDRFASFTDQLNSVPGGSGQILRATLYQLLDLPEPAHPVRVLPPDPPIPYRLEWPRSAQTAPLLATAVNEGPAVRVSRHPEVLVPGGSPALYRPHLVVREDEPDPRARDRADLVICEEGEATVWERLRAALERNRQSALAAVPEGDTCLLLTRDGLRYQLTPQEPFADPEVLASAFWRVRVDHDFAPPALVFTVRVGESSINVHVRPLDRMKRSSADHDNRCPAPGHVPRS